jgi:hypothetical protein
MLANVPQGRSRVALITAAAAAVTEQRIRWLGHGDADCCVAERYG